MIIGIDISLRSTAITIKNEKGYKFYSFITKNPDNKQLKTIEGFTKITPIEYLIDSKDYSENEIQKLDAYYKATESIIKVLAKVGKPEIINIEGYSQESQQGRLIDLVTFSTLLRIQLRLMFPDSKINIVAPKSMKKKAGEIVYGIGPDKKARNGVLNEKGVGKASGSFNKQDMLLCMYDFNTENKLKKYIDEYYKAIVLYKKIPSPIDDLVDSFFLTLL